MQLQTQSQLFLTGLGATNPKVKLTDFWSIAWPGTALMEVPCTKSAAVSAMQPPSGVPWLKLSQLPNQLLELHSAPEVLGVRNRHPVQSVPASVRIYRARLQQPWLGTETLKGDRFRNTGTPKGTLRCPGLPP